MYEMCKVWKERGAYVTVITSPYDKSDIQSEKFVSRMDVEGIQLIVINAGDSNKYGLIKRAFKATVFALVSSYYSITIKADALIASSGPITIGIPGIMGKIFSRKKLVFEVRDLWPGGAVEMGLIKGNILKKLFFWFEALCYRNSSLVVPCSLGMQRDINSRHNNVRCEVIPNACDNELFQNSSNVHFSYPSWFKKESIVLLYTGSLGLMDACDEIIHGFQIIEDKTNVHIVFIGDGTERSLLEELTRQDNLENHIHFLGLIPKTEVVQWYKIARVSFVVFKNYKVLGTSSPNKMFDSLAAGVPIIQNTLGWIKELVEKEKIGLSVLPNNSQSMSNAIEYFVRVGPETAEFRENSLLCARTKFDRRSLSLQYYEHLKQLK
jgi:glycosyltransferase involved in cell wall biosynthesis